MSTRTPARISTPPAERTERTLRGSIRRHPLTWFFTLAYGLSWVAWLPYVLSGNGLGVWHVTFPGGPGGPGASQLTGVLPGAYLGPIGSALLIIALTEGRAGLRTWRSRMTRFKVGRRWYLAVLVSVPLALILASAALSGDGPAQPSATVLLAFLPGLAAQMVTTGLAEEPGWREFAMPRMQRRLGPLAATLAVGVLWGCWHLPLFLTDWGGGPDVAWTEPVEFVATATLFSFVMTWVFNRSGESMPLVMLLHCGVNNYFSVAGEDLFPGMSHADVTHAFFLASLAGAVVALAATRGRLGLPERQPARTGAAAG